MMGGADILAAGIAYFVTNWKTYLSSVGSIGTFAIIAGLITVQKANFAPTKPTQRKSLIKEISSVAKRFFTSGENTFYGVEIGHKRSRQYGTDGTQPSVGI